MIKDEYTINEVAKMLGISISKIFNVIHEGKIRATKRRVNKEGHYKFFIPSKEIPALLAKKREVDKEAYITLQDASKLLNKKRVDVIKLIMNNEIKTIVENRTMKVRLKDIKIIRENMNKIVVEIPII